MGHEYFSIVHSNSSERERSSRKKRNDEFFHLYWMMAAKKKMEWKVLNFYFPCFLHSFLLNFTNERTSESLKKEQKFLYLVIFCATLRTWSTTQKKEEEIIKENFCSKKICHWMVLHHHKKKTRKGKYQMSPQVE